MNTTEETVEAIQKALTQDPKPISHFHLWIGGFETMGREQAVQMYLWSEDKSERGYMPRNPHILSAAGVPVAWFWSELQGEGDPAPELHPAMSKEYFSIHYVYEWIEFCQLNEDVMASY